MHRVVLESSNILAVTTASCMRGRWSGQSGRLSQHDVFSDRSFPNMQRIANILIHRPNPDESDEDGQAEELSI